MSSSPVAASRAAAFTTRAAAYFAIAKYFGSIPVNPHA